MVLGRLRLGVQGDTRQMEGPIGFNALKEMYHQGKLDKESKLWAQGMEGWRSLKQIPQLKW
jgi:DnaJ family protein C protein 13